MEESCAEVENAVHQTATGATQVQRRLSADQRQQVSMLFGHRSPLPLSPPHPLHTCMPSVYALHSSPGSAAPTAVAAPSSQGRDSSPFRSCSSRCTTLVRCTSHAWTARRAEAAAAKPWDRMSQAPVVCKPAHLLEGGWWGSRLVQGSSWPPQAQPPGCLISKLRTNSVCCTHPERAAQAGKLGQNRHGPG